MLTFTFPFDAERRSSECFDAEKVDGTVINKLQFLSFNLPRGHKFESGCLVYNKTLRHNRIKIGGRSRST